MFDPLGDRSRLAADVLELELLRHRIDAAQARLLAQLDQSGLTDTGRGCRPRPRCPAKPATVWDGHDGVRVSRVLVESFPQFLTALESGEISWEHCVTLIKVSHPRIVDDLSDLQDQRHQRWRSPPQRD